MVLVFVEVYLLENSDLTVALQRSAETNHVFGVEVDGSGLQLL